MEILWTALAICALVSIAFYFLAISWQRMLRNHAQAIRALSDRLDSIVDMDDPLLRRRISELTASPLERVFVFSFRLGDRFWRDMLGASEEQLRYVHERATFVGSVKVEVWRSHVTITLNELLPLGKSNSWQARTIDIYSSDSARAVLWDVCLIPAVHSLVKEPPSVELRYEVNAIVLAIRNAERKGWADRRSSESQDRTIFRIPLAAEKLTEFHVSEAETEEDAVARSFDAVPRSDRWLASYSHQDEQQDFDWHLRVRNLDGQTTSENWTVMEAPRARRIS